VARVDQRIAQTAALARTLVARAGLPAAHAALVAALDAIDRGEWPAVPLAILRAATPAPADFDVAVADLRRHGVIEPGATSEATLVLSARGRAALADPPPPRPHARWIEARPPGPVAPSIDALTADAAVVVATAAARDDRHAAILAATTGELAVLDAAAATSIELIDLAVDAWLRGVTIVVTLDDEATPWLDALAAVPARLVVSAPPRRLGELLARLRRVRVAVPLRPTPPPTTAARPDLPPTLRPLVGSAWAGLDAGAPTVRLARLAGPAAARAAAAVAVAAARARPHVVVDRATPGWFAIARDAAIDGAVVLVDGDGAIDEPEALALCGLTLEADATTLFADHDLPPAVAQLTPRLDLTLAAGSPRTRP
jgi:hypothetical protein